MSEEQQGCGINKNLVPMKMLLFCFNGGLGATWALLTVHMKALGLTLEQTAIISTLLPICSSIGSPIYSGFADKFAAYRSAYVIACFFTSLFYHSLMFVPPVYTPAKFPITTLSCDSQGVLFITPPCKRDEFDGSCGKLTNFTDDPLIATISNCRYVCNGTVVSATKEATFCRRRDVEDSPSETCLTLNLTQDGTKLELSFFTSEGETDWRNASGQCRHNLTSLIDKNEETSTAICKTSGVGCAVECDVQSDAIMLCNLLTGSPTFTFWAYFFVRVVAEIGVASCIPLIDTINIAMSKQYGGHFGRQHMFGALGMCLVAPLSGYLVDRFSVQGEIPNYRACFYLADLLFTGTSLVTIFFIKFTPPQKPKGMMSEVLKLFTNIPILALLTAVLSLGSFFGYLETFLYWYLTELGGTRLLLGLTLTAGLLPALPFLYYSNVVMDKLGAPYVVAFAFFVYAIRMTGYSLIVNPWHCLIFEFIEVFTWMLPRVAFSVYSATLAPPALAATTQSIVVLLHLFGGRGVGSFFGGYAVRYFGSRVAFRAVAVVAAIGGVIYLFIHQTIVIKIIEKNKAEAETSPEENKESN